ncbi:MAG: hypothetical protein KKF27_20905 [Gammaproteobacteria bacterium]|nr:hypothetical protein [Gammaproteobacteria bacterium]
MPSKWFRCPDNKTIEIETCLSVKGCRLGQRCATLPYLELVAYDREFKGVSPSAAGNGPRLIYLNAIKPYVISPKKRAFAAHGTGVHGKLSIHKYTHNVLSEESLSDEDMAGISDCLEHDEEYPGFFVLTDYKTYGSFKAAKCLGITQEQQPILDDTGNPVLLKSGKNKGKPKTQTITTANPDKADLREISLQLNRYRIFFERIGFPVSRIQIQIMVRDGGLYIAKNRGIEEEVYLVEIPRMADAEVLSYYGNLQAETDEAFKTGWIRKCNSWESWNGRRCSGVCDVVEACKEMEGE